MTRSRPRTSLSRATRCVAAFFCLSMPVHSLAQEASKPGGEASLEEKLGQMLIVGVAASEPDDPEVELLEREMEAGRVGGILLLRHNVKKRDDFEALVHRLAQSPSRHPALIMVDQEGGFVQRLSPRVGYSRLPSASSMAASASPEEARRLYQETARTLRATGINMNLAPVVDLNLNPRSPAIGRLGRSYGADERTVTAFARAFVESHRKMGIATVLKHFPGHGSSDGDTHAGQTDISRTWSRKELAPFRSLISAGLADAIMMGHLFHASLDDRWPATLSRSIVTGLLRTQMGFEGVIITDDLNMKSVKERLPLPALLETAVRAGNDLVVVSSLRHKGRTVPALFQAALIEAVRKGRISRSAIDASYQRIRRLKEKLGKDLPEGSGETPSAGLGRSPLLRP